MSEGCEKLHMVFIPPKGQGGARTFSIHEWMMRGSTVEQVLSVRRFPVRELRFFAGVTFDVPPDDLMEAVREIEAAGGNVSGPEGWRQVRDLPRQSSSAT